MTTTTNQPEAKPLTAKEITRKMIADAKAKNGGKLGGNGDG
jgi:hypothetical protein